MKEIWKIIPGYEKYEVSNMGLLRTHNWKGSGRTVVMKPALDESGYLRTVLINDKGEKKTIRVHRMVCMAFHGIPTEVMTVNHKNYIKTDNRPENLEWMTQMENAMEAYHLGKHVVLKGEQIGNSILKAHQVLEIRKKFIPRVYGRKKLSEEYGVKECTIKDILSRRSWNWLK